ncbi:type II restriction endonuclease [Lysinibacillus capsici]|uniref:type II restriction endonuclease n=1 Tax=Lysinibacillus capsici TaxID=2115968 RepID=UPI001CD9B2A5|nr:type II restriction endonuclease [Lysinibacillus capsici]
MSNSTDFDFITLFYNKVLEMNINWDVKGLIANQNTIYAIGNDSKLLGRIFEIIAAPVIKAIAEEHGYQVKIPDKQNTYPDFTLFKDENDKNKIAIDVKTTYKEGNKKLGFTLGSFTSFIRDNKKNIAYPYSDYSDHFIIGFIYERNHSAEEGQIVDYNNLSELPVPYNNVDFFVRKKIDITGQKKGSGNTDNMGSIACTNVKEFQYANGPFNYLSDNLYLHYWRNYPKNTQKDKYYLDLESYFDWLEEHIQDPKSTHDKNQLQILLEEKESYNAWKDSTNNIG